MESSTPFRPGRSARARMLVRKDRHAATLLGGNPQDDGRVYIGEVVLDGTGELSWTAETAITVTIEPHRDERQAAASVVTRLRELVKPPSDDDPITSIRAGPRGPEGAARRRSTNAYDFLETTVRWPRFAVVSSGAQTPHSPAAETMMRTTDADGSRFVLRTGTGNQRFPLCFGNHWDHGNQREPPGNHRGSRFRCLEPNGNQRYPHVIPLYQPWPNRPYLTMRRTTA